MQLLELTLPTPAENLALDEALLEAAEAAPAPLETLRLWESPQPLVVVGRSSQVALEVNLDVCRQRQIPVVRRTSGGAAIVAGPGSLMYAVVLSYESRPALRSVDAAHRFVLDKLITAISPLEPAHSAAAGVTRKGTSDLTLGDAKFSGNSLRCKRRAMLYHGTLLYNFPLELIGQCLLMPPRQPEYRQHRAHGDFVTNLPLQRAAITAAIKTVWEASEPCADWPRERVADLVATRYASAEWNLGR